MLFHGAVGVESHGPKKTLHLPVSGPPVAKDQLPPKGGGKKEDY